MPVYEFIFHGPTRVVSDGFDYYSSRSTYRCRHVIEEEKPSYETIKSIADRDEMELRQKYNKVISFVRHRRLTRVVYYTFEYRATLFCGLTWLRKRTFGLIDPPDINNNSLLGTVLISKARELYKLDKDTDIKYLGAYEKYE